MSTWEVQYSAEAARWLRKADPQIARKVRDAMKAIAQMDNPRDRGKALTANRTGLWRYRLGNLRIICDIQDGQFLIVALQIGNRDHIYD